jgi:hypothetical protein
MSCCAEGECRQYHATAVERAKEMSKTPCVPINTDANPYANAVEGALRLRGSVLCVPMNCYVSPNSMQMPKSESPSRPLPLEEMSKTPCVSKSCRVGPEVLPVSMPVSY